MPFSERPHPFCTFRKAPPGTFSCDLRSSESRLFDDTIKAGFRLKFDKLNLAQLVVECLGFLIGRGVKALSPSKVESIVVWPRPTRAAGTDRLLGFGGLLRDQP